MTSTHHKELPEQEPGGRYMTMTTAQNPRRSPAAAGRSKDASVLQDGRKRQKLSHSPEKELRPQRTHTIGDDTLRVCTSQESGSSDQSGSKWFNAANKNIDSGRPHPSEIDDDPPFYMSNHPNYVPQNFIASEDSRLFGGQSRLDSENEDLRGVIDDLTVENKRLKYLIRAQQRHSRHTPSETPQQQQDKLFEVRMHGLPPEKRRELEFLLKNFATSVHTSVPSKTTSTSNTDASATSSGQHVKTAAPRTDSGYASNTTSGGNSTLAHLAAPPPKSSSNKAVRNYLQDIPIALLPKHNPIMSERAKQALVVRRLEQLFTGRKAAPGEHVHPIQQQEISQSAAMADRAQDAKLNKKRKAEGHREARVMPPDTKVNLDAFDYSDGKDYYSPRWRAEAATLSRPGSPDQRPTRPLDLDIHRAQAAAENLQYIRHLGLTSPHLGIQPATDQESAWIYLNLVFSLAQLHTLNVTPDFVRKAIKKLSKRFELSKDGQKLRWIGGDDGTKFSAEDEKAIETADISPQESPEEAGTGGSSKRSKTDSTSNAAITSNTPSEEQTSGLQTSSGSKLQQTNTSGSNLQSGSGPTKATTQGSAFDYKPIVFKETSRLGFDEYQNSDESMDSQSADSSGLVHALSRSNLNQASKEEGLITFYNNPYFCSDFSAEQDPSNMKPPKMAIIGETLGLAVPTDLCESPLRHHDATYFTSHFAPKPFDPSALTPEDKTRFEASLPNLPELLPLSEAGEHETVPREMDVCGLGGVYPEDNFALDIKSLLKPCPTQGNRAMVRKLPFSRRKYLQKYTTEVESCDKITLIPSKLPPPSYIFFTSSSSSEDPAVADDNMSESSDSSSSPFVDETYPAPPAFLQQFSGSSAENLGDDEEDMTSSEIDMLALARRVNPQEIAEQERVYMINQPGGISRAVAGSLAATVGASRSGSSILNAQVATSSVSGASIESNLSNEADEEMDEA